MKKPKRVVEDLPQEVETRLTWLEHVIDQEYGGSPAEFERKTGIKVAQVGQWFSGFRLLRERALRRLEAATKKPLGFYDRQTQDEQVACTSAPAPLIPTSPGARYLVLALGRLLSPLDPLDREQAGVILAGLATAPENSEIMASKLERLLGELPTPEGRLPRENLR